MVSSGVSASRAESDGTLLAGDASAHGFQSVSWIRLVRQKQDLERGHALRLSVDVRRKLGELSSHGRDVPTEVRKEVVEVALDLFFARGVETKDNIETSWSNERLVERRFVAA